MRVPPYKVKLISMDRFEKMRLDHQRTPRKLDPFLECFVFFPNIFFYVNKCFNAYIKCLDTLSPILTGASPVLWAFWRRKKHVKRGHFFLVLQGSILFFFQNGPKNQFWFLRCNQCIKMLHLSYQVAIYNDFHLMVFRGSNHYAKGKVGQRRFSKSFFGPQDLSHPYKCQALKEFQT